ncbi:sensor histidine kinase [Fibrella aquatilis]|uniref:Oxygen sensor histidine kinase NreB n=1 Tax=Fibrella aquatilis TaxID=2817059 RepID=A0A939G2G3_9BACT|nr:sensor histidine kinase [Fibrella aquatilis]MBO0929414.1 sensor histidine kinase [Fibrella aquatilis]
MHLRLLLISWLSLGHVWAQHGPNSINPAPNPIIDTLLAKLTGLRQQPASVGRDTTLWLTTSLVTERLCNLRDPRAAAYLDSLRQLLLRLPWAKGEGLLWRATGKSYDASGRYQPALAAYMRAATLLEKAGGDTYELTYTYILIAFVLNNTNQTPACIRWLEKARPLATKSLNTNNICWILDFYGDYNFYEKWGIRNYKKALGYYLAVERLLPRATSPRLKADNPHMLAACYLYLGDTLRASTYRQQALTISRLVNDRIVPFAVHADLADISASRHQYPQAVAYADTALHYAQLSGWPEMISRAEGALARYNHLVGNDRTAYTLLNQFHRHEDSLSRVAVQKQFNELQTKYNAQNNQLKISQLEQASAQRVRNSLWILLGIGGLIGGLVIYGNQRLRRANRLLLASHEATRTALMTGQTQERKRVATELHDSLNTKVAPIRWRLQAVPTGRWPQRDQVNYAEVLAMVNELYDDIRLISHGMLPHNLATQSLHMVLQKLVGQLNQRGPIRFQLVADDTTANLTDPIKFQVYSIVLELTNNVLRHARASHVWISLSQTDTTLVLTVSDDGLGFNPDQPSEGMGLQNIDSRVQSLGGVWAVTSRPNEGTQIRLTVPKGVV